MRQLDNQIRCPECYAIVKYSIALFLDVERIQLSTTQILILQIVSFDFFTLRFSLIVRVASHILIHRFFTMSISYIVRVASQIFFQVIFLLSFRILLLYSKLCSIIVILIDTFSLPLCQMVRHEVLALIFIGSNPIGVAVSE